MTGRALRIVLSADTVANYPEGGGHQSWALQYLLGLLDLGHEATWLELMWSTGDPASDQANAMRFLDMTARHGARDRCLVVIKDESREEHPLEYGEVFGASRDVAQRTLRSADMLWDLALSAPASLRQTFPVTVLLDGDPGHLQAAALAHPLPLAEYDIRFTVGGNVGRPGCPVPDLGLSWVYAPPCVHLPMWPRLPSPPDGAPISSITHWNWGEQDPMIDGHLVSTSKRLAHLRYVGLPMSVRRKFSLGAHLHASDTSGDREILENHGWTITDPWLVAASPEDYATFIAGSWAELSCPKPIYTQLRTGWFSDRSAVYLATGRPVVMEDTGVGDHLPTGDGLVLFRDFPEAVDAFGCLDAEWDRHATAARELAERYFNARTVLSGMVDRCR